MKEYKEIKVMKKITEAITCNKCGKTKIITENGFEEDHFHTIDLTFGYGSKHDEEKWQFDLCEECIEDYVKTFKHSPGVSRA